MTATTAPKHDALYWAASWALKHDAMDIPMARKQTHALKIAYYLDLPVGITYPQLIQIADAIVDHA